MNKVWIQLVCFCLGFLLVERFCHKKTDGFAISHVLSDLPIREGDKEPLPEGIKKILSRPFTFLGSGGQSYAFLSEDKKAVLKVFKHHHLKPLFTSSEKKREAFFASCELSFNELRDESALLYVHLHKTNHLKQSLTLVDKLGIQHTLDLDNLEFLLQQRVSLALRSVKKQVERNNLLSAEKAILSIVEMVGTRCQKGIQDTDNGMRRNMGLLEGRAVAIDTGSFARNWEIRKKDQMRKEIREKTWRLARFLKLRDEKLLQRYNQAVEKVVDEKGI
ncbi:MAG: hypothetical protein ACHQT8_06255 [Chlamydiales bacterium]